MPFCLDEIEQRSTLAISEVTQMELFVGCRNKTELRKTERFLQRFRVLRLNEQISDTAIHLLEEGKGKIMLTYKAMHKYLDEGVHAEVLDFPGVITWDTSLEEARRLLASALVDVAETNLLKGESLPQPDPTCSNPDADLEEPIHLLLKAASRVLLVPQEAVP